MKSDERASPDRLPAHAPKGLERHPVDWVVESNAVGDVLQEMEELLRSRRRRRLRAMTATAVAFLFAGVVWHRARAPKLVTERASPSSAVVSLPERQVLSDGSIVELRNGAQIAVAFTDAVRRVVLTRGEAHFQVAKMARPFVVAAGGVEVRAVGTAFLVQFGSTQVDVVVTEGRVAVDPEAEDPGIRRGGSGPASSLLPPPSSALLVEVGHRVVVPVGAVSASHSSPQVVPVETAELAARLAWRSPRLEFSRTPLADALVMMNQHAAPGKNMNVILAEPSLGRVEVSGMLRADNLETLLRLLEEEHGFKIEYRNPQEVVLRQGR